MIFIIASIALFALFSTVFPSITAAILFTVTATVCICVLDVLFHKKEYEEMATVKIKRG